MRCLEGTVDEEKETKKAAAENCVRPSPAVAAIARRVDGQQPKSDVFNDGIEGDRRTYL